MKRWEVLVKNENEKKNRVKKHYIQTKGKERLCYVSIFQVGIGKDEGLVTLKFH